LNWYQVLEEIKKKDKIYDLSTGSPLILPEVSAHVLHSLHELSSSVALSREIASYTDTYGLPELIDSFIEQCSNDFKCEIHPKQVFVVPGVQAGLRYIQEIIHAQGKRILFPLGLEFPGASNNLLSAECSCGIYRSVNCDDIYCKPLLDLSGADWTRVGAVLISRPHNPTGRYWSKLEIENAASAARDRNALLLLDETYALPFAPLIPDKGRAPFHAENVLHLYSFSKVGLASERVGVVIGPEQIITLLRSVLRNNIIQPPRIGQYVAASLIPFFQEYPDVASKFSRLFQAHYNIGQTFLKGTKVRGNPLRITAWEGGPFLWCEWEGSPTGDGLFWSLLEAGVAVAPESALRVGSFIEKRSTLNGMRIGLGETTRNLEAGFAVISEVLRRSK
jgi:valine--pyruvate aminotransferase